MGKRKVTIVTVKKGKYTAKLRDQFIDLINNGKTIEQATGEIGISRMTEYRYRQLHPEYADNVQDAKLIRIEAIESSLFEKAIEGNVIAAIFLLKCWNKKRYLPELNIDKKDETVEFDFVAYKTDE